MESIRILNGDVKMVCSVSIGRIKVVTDGDCPFCEMKDGNHDEECVFSDSGVDEEKTP